jgi:hypothetical protein
MSIQFTHTHTHTHTHIYIIVTDMEGNIRIYRLPKGRGTDQWK